jgi:hypothetical protein
MYRPDVVIAWGITDLDGTLHVFVERLKLLLDFESWDVQGFDQEGMRVDVCRLLLCSVAVI